MGNKANSRRKKTSDSTEENSSNSNRSNENDFSGYYHEKGNGNDKSAPNKSLHSKSTKHLEVNYPELLFTEVAKDVRLINLRQCEDYIERSRGSEFLSQIQNYTGATMLHL